MCNTDYEAWRLGRLTLPNEPPVAPARSVDERFWSKVIRQANGCWEWQAQTIEGYGRFYPVHGVGVAAHRWAYEKLVGEIPDGLDLDHQCHNRDSDCAGGTSCSHRRCVNPAHLEPSTRRVNLLRGRTIVAAEAKRTHCPNGHPYTPENTQRWRGKRSCILCDSIQGSARRRAANPDLRPAPALRRTCPSGHPYDAGNTYVDRKGHRHCRACRYEAWHRWYKRQKGRSA